MKLNDPLVTEICFKGQTYFLDLAFDNVLDVLDWLNDDEVDPYERLDASLELLVGIDDTEIYSDFRELDQKDQLELYQEIVNKHIRFSVEEQIEYDRKGFEIKKKKKNEQVIDYEYDAKYIFASFFALGINLFEQQGKLSWIEFQALLETLPEDSIMSRIISIRQWKPSKGETKEYRTEMKKLQKKHALPNAEVGDEYE